MVKVLCGTIADLLDCSEYCCCGLAFHSGTGDGDSYSYSYGYLYLDHSEYSNKLGEGSGCRYYSGFRAA